VSRRDDEIWADRGERAYGTFTRHPFLSSIGGFGALIAIIVIIGIIGGIGHFALGWFNKAGEVAGPANVSSQYQKVISDWNSMQQAAINACAAKDSSKQSGDPTLLEDPSFAYQAVYRHIVVDYDTRQNDIFEAKLVGPSGYPRTAPSLEAMEAQVC
jgi:hypothetical protein